MWAQFPSISRIFHQRRRARRARIPSWSPSHDLTYLPPPLLPHPSPSPSLKCCSSRFAEREEGIAPIPHTTTTETDDFTAADEKRKLSCYACVPLNRSGSYPTMTMTAEAIAVAENGQMSRGGPREKGWGARACYRGIVKPTWAE